MYFIGNWIASLSDSGMSVLGQAVGLFYAFSVIAVYIGTSYTRMPLWLEMLIRWTLISILTLGFLLYFLLIFLYR